MQTTVSPSQTFTVITSRQQKPSKPNIIENYAYKQALYSGLLQVSILSVELCVDSHSHLQNMNKIIMQMEFYFARHVWV